MLTKVVKRSTKLVNPVQARMFGHKIKVTNEVVDMDGDEMTKIIWKWIKERVSLTLFCVQSVFDPICGLIH